jgi:integrase
LDELHASYLETVSANRSPWTLKMQSVHWRHFLRVWSALDEITPAAIERYKVDRLGSADASTVYKELVTLSRFFRWCKRHGLIDHVPEFERPRPASDYKPPDLTRADVVKLLGELPPKVEHPKHYPAREFFTVLWAQALRSGELRSLRWADVDLERARLTIRPARDKARQGRTIALAPEAVTTFHELAALPLLPSGLVFGGMDMRESLALAAGRAGLPHVTPHHLRHARLSELASASRDVAAVQYFAGHQSLTTTDRYVRSRTERTEELLRSLLDSGAPHRNEAPKPRKRAGRKS